MTSKHVDAAACRLADRTADVAAKEKYLRCERVESAGMAKMFLA